MKTVLKLEDHFETEARMLSKEVTKKMKRFSDLVLAGGVTLCVLMTAFMTGDTVAMVSAGESQVRRPVIPSPPTLQEAPVIIEAAIAHARKLNQRLTVVVADEAGNLISADRMDGASFHLERFAAGKALAAVMLRQPTAKIVELLKSRPDRYFGTLHMFPGRVYLVPGGVPLMLEGRIIGAVGVAGLRVGLDDQAAEAGIATWRKYLEGKSD